MKAVNLLPPDLRSAPLLATAGRGSAPASGGPGPYLVLGALALAILASLAASRTDTLVASGDGSLGALTAGYHLAFAVGALFAVAAAALAALLLRTGAPAHEGEDATGVPAAAEGC